MADRILVKWTGSKASGGPIVALFPRVIDTYFEPLIGEVRSSTPSSPATSSSDGSSVATSASRSSISGTWSSTSPQALRRYDPMWRGLEPEGKAYYYAIRQTFNLTGDPCQFFFLLRTCRHGLIRFNRRGEFNVGFGLGMHKVEPEELGRYLKIGTGS